MIGTVFRAWMNQLRNHANRQHPTETSQEKVGWAIHRFDS